MRGGCGDERTCGYSFSDRVEPFGAFRVSFSVTVCVEGVGINPSNSGHRLLLDVLSAIDQPSITLSTRGRDLGAEGEYGRTRRTFQLV